MRGKLVRGFVTKLNAVPLQPLGAVALAHSRIPWELVQEAGGYLRERISHRISHARQRPSAGKYV